MMTFRFDPAFEHELMWNVNPSVPHQISPGGRGAFAGIWEAPYQHYVNEKGLEMPYTKQIIWGTNIIVNGRNKNQPGVYRPEGGNLNTGIGWGNIDDVQGNPGFAGRKIATVQDSAAQRQSCLAGIPARSAQSPLFLRARQQCLPCSGGL